MHCLKTHCQTCQHPEKTAPTQINCLSLSLSFALLHTQAHKHSCLSLALGSQENNDFPHPLLSPENSLEKSLFC